MEMIFVSLIGVVSVLQVVAIIFAMIEVKRVSGRIVH